MHAVEWIAENACYKRTISLDTLRRKLGREKGHCTWCNAEIRPGAARSRWCSEVCRDEGYIRGGWWHGAVEARDKGVCAHCGLDTLALQRRLRELWMKAKGKWDPIKGHTRTFPHSWARLRRWCAATGIETARQPYEIDHIIPVVEGGGCCGLDNLRTLCFCCHKQVTKELARRRAAARKDKRRTLFTMR